MKILKTCWSFHITWNYVILSLDMNNFGVTVSLGLGAIIKWHWQYRSIHFTLVLYWANCKIVFHGLFFNIILGKLLILFCFLFLDSVTSSLLFCSVCFWFTIFSWWRTSSNSSYISMNGNLDFSRQCIYEKRFSIILTLDHSYIIPGHKPFHLEFRRRCSIAF